MGKITKLIILFFSVCYYSASYATETIFDQVEAKRTEGYSISQISPIFGQLVRLSLPKDFIPVFEKTSGENYIREAVPSRESVEKWSQMLTVTGRRGLASNHNVTPALMANAMAGTFKKVCPDTFTAISLGAARFNGFDAIGVFIGCGTVSSAGDKYSEIALMIFIKGESDYYTIQWAERGRATQFAPQYEAVKWLERYKQLQPIMLCPIISGEVAPYPSCVGEKGVWEDLNK